MALNLFSIPKEKDSRPETGMGKRTPFCDDSYHFCALPLIKVHQTNATTAAAI